MPYQSPYPDLHIPQCNILSYAFPENQELSEKPVWIDAANPSHSLSPAQMLSWVKRFALGLDDLNIPKQRAIMVYTPNHLYVTVAYFAAAGSCRMFTGANPTYTANEVAHQLQTIEAALFFVHPSLLTNGIKAAKQANFPLTHVYQFSDAQQATSPEGVRDWREMLAPSSRAQSWTWDPLTAPGAASSTICCVNFSSGTTGLPKGVCISHANLIANTAQCVFNKFHNPTNPSQPTTLPANERWLAMLPLYHAYSQLWTINIACRLGVPVYIMSTFTLPAFLSHIQTHKITTLQTVPPVIIMLAKHPSVSQYNLSTITHIMSGAAPLDPALQNALATKLNCTIIQGWGMTETTCVGIIIPGSLNDAEGSIGYLLPNTTAKLIDPETNTEVSGDGARGELLIRGPQITKAYWRRPDATKDSFDEEGYFRSGDVAVVRHDPDGKHRWWIVDRMKELIKVKGLQVAPAELEAVLLGHPEVADAAVCGVQVDGDEAPRAYVVRQEGGKVSEEEVEGWVAEKVAKHKRLTGGVAFVEVIPKLPSGKIVRKVMREWGRRDEGLVRGSVRQRL